MKLNVSSVKLHGHNPILQQASENLENLEFRMLAYQDKSNNTKDTQIL